MNRRPLIINILLAVGFFLIAGMVMSIIFGLLSGLLWLAIKILIPVAIAVWLVRVISNPSKKQRRYY